MPSAMAELLLWLGAVLAASLLMLAGMWLCSGTMSLYGATIPQHSLIDPCRYIVNIDHMHFEATYRMLQGQDLGLWSFSLVLRRILYPLGGPIPSCACWAIWRAASWPTWGWPWRRCAPGPGSWGAG